MFRWHIGFYSSQGWNNVVGFWQWRWKEMKRCKRYFGQIERSRWWAKYERQYRRSSNGGWVLGWWLNETFPRGREHRRRPQPCMPCFSLRKSFKTIWALRNYKVNNIFLCNFSNWWQNFLSLSRLQKYKSKVYLCSLTFEELRITDKKP